MADAWNYRDKMLRIELSEIIIIITSQLSKRTFSLEYRVEASNYSLK